MQTKDMNLIISFVRGLVDTDFGLVIRNKYGKPYPTLEGSSSSKRLILSLSEIFDKLMIKHFISTDVKRFEKRTNKIYIINKIIISGYSRLNYFFNIIKPKNNKYIKRINKVGLRRFEFGK